MVNLEAASPICDLSDARFVGATPYHETYVDHAEGVCVAKDGTLFAGGEDGQIYRIDPGTNTVKEIANTGGFTLGLTLDPSEERLFVCDFKQHAVYRLELDDDWSPVGDVNAFVQGSEKEWPIQPNFCVFDQDGRMYLSDSGDRTAQMDQSGGNVMMIEPDGEERLLTDELSAWTNGLALSQDESILYVAETGTEQVSAVHLDDSGHVVDIEPIQADFGHVDGLAMDTEDNLYVVSIGDDAVYRWRDGETDVIVHDPTGLSICNPTNVAFGGSDMKTMYIANLGLTHITAVDIDKPGRLPTARLE